MVFSFSFVLSLFRFRIFDTDQNGFLEKEEVEHLVSVLYKLSVGLEEGGSKPFPSFSELDRDGDGKVGLNEFIDCCKEYDSIISTLESCLLNSLKGDNTCFIFTFSHFLVSQECFEGRRERKMKSFEHQGRNYL